MQTATVLYLTDAATLPPDLDLPEAAARAGLDPIWTEPAATLAPFPRVEDALLRLAQRGAATVDIVAGSWNGEGELLLSDRRLRLRG